MTFSFFVCQCQTLFLPSRITPFFFLKVFSQEKTPSSKLFIFSQVNGSTGINIFKVREQKSIPASADFPFLSPTGITVCNWRRSWFLWWICLIVHSTEGLGWLKLGQDLQHHCRTVNFVELTVLLPRGELHGPYLNLCFLISLEYSLAFHSWVVLSSVKHWAIVSRQRGAILLFSGVTLFLSVWNWTVLNAIYYFKNYMRRKVCSLHSQKALEEYFSLLYFS